MYKIRNIFLVFIVSFSIAFGIGTERHSLNNSVSTKEQQFSSWKIEDVFAGQDFYLLWAKDDQGKDHIYTWGENGSGQLGNGTKIKNYTPTEINYGKDWNSLDQGWVVQQVDVGLQTTMVVVEDVNGDDHLYGWGENSYYDLGLGTANDISTPSEISYGSSMKQEEITDLSTSGRLAIISTLDSSGNNHFYTAGTEAQGELGNGGNNGSGNGQGVASTNKTFKEISYSDSDLKSSSDYTLKGVFADGYSNTYTNDDAIGFKHNNEATYIWVENDNGDDEIYGAGANYNKSLLGFGSPVTGWGITSFKRVTLPKTIDQNEGNIKLFYSSELTVDDNYVGDPEYTSVLPVTYYSGIVYTDNNGIDRLYTWGANGNATLGNGQINSITTSPRITENFLTNGKTNLPRNYTIDYVEANSYNSYAVVTDQNSKEQSIYFWGTSKEKGLSTYKTNDPSSDYNNDFYSKPIEINYPENLDLKTNRVTNISGGFNNTFLLTEDDNQIQHLYIWGDNSKNLVSESTDKIIYQPTLIFNSINIIDSKIKVINENNINYSFTVENGNQLTKIIMKDEQGNQDNFSEEDWKVTDSDQYSTTYSLRVDDLLDGTYDFDQIFYNSYFNFTIINPGENIFIESPAPVVPSTSSYLWIIILIACILILIALWLILIYLKKRNKKLKIKIEKDIYLLKNIEREYLS